MAAKNDTPLPEAPVPTLAESRPVLVAEAPRRRLPGLALAGVIVGAVLVAGALFGGGVLVGSNLPGTGPTQGQFGADGRPEFPGGGFDRSGDGQRPNPPAPNGDRPQGGAPHGDTD